jgi:glucose/arabinose dehydrogenase/lysophospholipase L1-like esterase
MQHLRLVLIGGLLGLLALAGTARAADSAAARLKLEKGDHVSLIGNTLADRMQHHGWLETLLYANFPDDDLVFRNLGFSGDELTLRLRSAKFGTPDEHLAANQTDVIFAFFGYNESYAGEKGLPKFKQDLEKFVKDTEGKKYNGKSAPRLVLFSPIAQENLHDANLPDGVEHNKNIKLYTDAMSEVAAANNVAFVDLFRISQAIYGNAGTPLTIDGVHLNEHGDMLLAPTILHALFLDLPMKKMDGGMIDKIRAAVLDKNLYWFNRYRTVDGYNVYGGRAYEKYGPPGTADKDKVTNLVVMQREMTQLDVMTANRDKVIWAAAHNQVIKPDDSDLPAEIPVKTNKPGPLPGGKYPFRGGEEIIKDLKIGANLKINLFASEEQFPELEKPVQMAWDTKGRLWVACWPTYPHWKPTEPMQDKLVILEDTNGDGKADKLTVFADHLNCPTGFEFYNGGVLLAQAPDILFIKDTTGGDHANYVERVVDGMDSADSHHTSNSFTFDPGGAIYWQEGTFHHTQVETPWGPAEHCVNAGVYRFEPKTFKFEAYTSYGFANPHGHVFDKWGTDVIIDGTGSQPYYGPSFTGKMYYPDKHKGGAPQIYRQRTRPTPGAEILSSAHFPDDWQGDMLVGNVITVQGILRYKLNEKGSGIAAVEQEPIVFADTKKDQNFRPSDIEIGPDGAIYFLDWQNPIIGHLQHHLRDPSRDHTHGRVYRVTYEGRPLLTPPAIFGQSVAKLLDLLKDTNYRVQYRAKIELSAHKSEEVIPAVNSWVAALDKADPNYEHNMMQALWVHQWNNVVDLDLLQRMLKSPDYHARAAAVRVLCYWRDRVPNALDLLKVAANDKEARVRLEAVRSCSFFTDPKAQDVALDALNGGEDPFLKYALDETMRTLERAAKMK